jgi:hypothetical protein
MWSNRGSCSMLCRSCSESWRGSGSPCWVWQGWWRQTNI